MTCQRRLRADGAVSEGATTEWSLRGGLMTGDGTRDCPAVPNAGARAWAAYPYPWLRGHHGSTRFGRGPEVRAPRAREREDRPACNLLVLAVCVRRITGTNFLLYSTACS